MTVQRYEWHILQTGDLPLSPDGRINMARQHICTSVLLWPEGRTPDPETTIMTDPCLVSDDLTATRQYLEERGFVLPDIGCFFVTHEHMDHLPFIGSYRVSLYGIPLVIALKKKLFADLTLVACPGHAPELNALVFQDVRDKQVWIVGDAILGEDWLLAWKYYWPNGYGKGQVMETWRSVAKILAVADTVIPGHGRVFDITVDLLKAVLAGFARAEYADECPDVEDVLQKRLAALTEQPDVSDSE